MRRLSLIALSSSVIALSAAGLCAAQDSVQDTIPASKAPVIEPAPATSTAPVIKTQHVRAEDLTPEQLQALLDEANKVREFKRTIRTGSVAPDVTSTARTHAVVKGDTLFNISQRYGVSVARMQAANGLSNSYISLGQTLVVPTPIAEAPTVQPAAGQPPAGSKDKAERPSETVAFAGLPVADGSVTRRIVQALPDQPQTEHVDDATTQVYAVLPKDTLYSISRRSCVGMAELVARNDIADPASLKPGQRLSLPDGHCLPR